MPITLRFPLSQNPTGHFGIPKGATGRAGHGIAGICLHVLETTLENYLSYLGSNLNLADVRPGEHGSVHYGIEAGGSIHQFVADTNSAWGIQSLHNPTWSLLPDFSGVNLNYVFLQIAVERYISAEMPTQMFRALAELVAKLCVDHTLDVDAEHIIAHSELDDAFATCANGLATNLIATVQTLIAQGTGQVTQDLSMLTSQVAALQVQVDTLSNDFTASMATISTYASHVTTVAGLSTLGHVKASSTIDINGTSGVEAVKSFIAAYKVNPSTPQTIVPSIQAIVQFPTVISDSNGWATLGAFQKVTPGLAGTYRLRARVEFDAADWSGDKVIMLSCYKNGSPLQVLCVKTMEANLVAGTLQVAGEAVFVQATLTDYYDVRLVLDDLNGAKSIVGGEFLLEKVGA